MTAPARDDHPLPDDAERLCFCMVVSAGEIRAAIAAGARTVEAIQYATGACTGCGTCRLDVEELLEQAGHPVGPDHR